MQKKFPLTLLLFISLSFGSCFGQTYKMKNILTQEDQLKLVSFAKEVFENEVNFNFSISTSDVLKSFSDLKDQPKYDDEYLLKLKAQLEKDSHNSTFLNDLGNYFNFHEKSDSASFYFNEALKNLTVKDCNNDSAFYFSFRGVIKLNLKLDNAIDDIEHALKINPSDSLAVNFYPMFLFNKGEFKKAKMISIAALDKDTSQVLGPFIILAMSEIMGGLIEKMDIASKDEKQRIKYSQTDYDKIIDFKMIDKYSLKYKNNIYIKNARNMVDLLGIVSKLVFSDTKNRGMKFSLTSNEKTKLESLEKKFLQPSINNELNQYAINKNLGYINFMLHKWDKSVVYLKKDIEEFPESKKRQQFNPSDSYDAILTIYKLSNDSINYKKTLIEKIKKEPEGRKNVKNYLSLAILYYRSNELAEAEDWANKANAIDSKNFEVLRLLSHLNYIKGNDFECQFYGNYAVQYAQSNYNLYEIDLQFGIYHLIAGDANTAYDNISKSKGALEGQSCEICDTLVKDYITVINK